MQWWIVWVTFESVCFASGAVVGYWIGARRVRPSPLIEYRPISEEQSQAFSERMREAMSSVQLPQSTNRRPDVQQPRREP